jgi:glycosyltransferase involved in cell wall biosynthesis
MRVCMLAYAFYESDMRILRYAKSLVERGDTVDVIALRRDSAARFEVLDGVNVYRIQSRERNERGLLDYLVRLVRFMFLSAFIVTRKYVSKPYDIIHVHSVPDFLVFAALIPKLLGAKIILDIHDILPEFFASKFGTSRTSVKFKLLLLAENFSVYLSDHVIIANDLWHERVATRTNSTERCTTVINYPDPELFERRSRTGPASDKFRVTYPGTLNTHQGLDIALHAMAELKENNPEIELHIYGEGPAKASLMELSSDLELSNVVHFHEFLPCDKIADVMALSDLAVVPKRASSSFGNEAMSTKIMEFMSLGVPVIVSRTKVDTYYHNDSRVMFFDSEDPHDLARAILLLRHDAQLRAQLEENASAYVTLNNWHEKKKVYLKLVDDLASSGGAGQEPVRGVVN